MTLDKWGNLPDNGATKSTGWEGSSVRQCMDSDNLHRRLKKIIGHVLHGILCTKGSEGFQVLVNRARAQIAAARHGDLTGTKAAQQCAEKVVACAHLA